uniref:U3 small nucleolar ribonucleoprotein protein MPP10 n=1 Tax=Globodera rostochiensis TaxID=31243 RepID=A0A914HPH0_GLORO
MAPKRNKQSKAKDRSPKSTDLDTANKNIEGQDNAKTPATARRSRRLQGAEVEFTENVLEEIEREKRSSRSRSRSATPSTDRPSKSKTFDGLKKTSAGPSNSQPNCLATHCPSDGLAADCINRRRSSPQRLRVDFDDSEANESFGISDKSLGGKAKKFSPRNVVEKRRSKDGKSPKMLSVEADDDDHQNGGGDKKQNGGDKMQKDVVVGVDGVEAVEEGEDQLFSEDEQIGQEEEESEAEHEEGNAFQTKTKQMHNIGAEEEEERGELNWTTDDMETNDEMAVGCSAERREEGEVGDDDDGHDEGEEVEEDDGHDEGEEVEEDDGHDEGEEVEEDDGHDEGEEVEEDDGHDEGEEVEEDDGHDEGEEVEEDDGHDEEDDGHDEGEEVEEDDGHDEGEEVEEDDGHDEGEEGGPCSYEEDVEDAGTVQERRKKLPKSSLDDKFFNLAEMNAFLEAEDKKEEEKDRKRKSRNLGQIENADEMDQLISSYEEANLRPRDWALSGEAIAEGRAKDALLEQFVEVDYRATAPPTINEEKTAQLEAIISKRIKDGKVRKSLAEVYGDKFATKINEGEQLGGDAKPKLDPTVEGIKHDLDKLFLKLDALSHFQFRPQPIREDVKIVNNMPSLHMEEVGPQAAVGPEVNLLAPEEVKRRVKSAPKATDERTETDRKRQRRQKKKKQRILASIGAMNGGEVGGEASERVTKRKKDGEGTEKKKKRKLLGRDGKEKKRKRTKSKLADE